MSAAWLIRAQFRVPASSGGTRESLHKSMLACGGCRPTCSPQAGCSDCDGCVHCTQFGPLCFLGRLRWRALGAMHGALAVHNCPWTYLFCCQSSQHVYQSAAGGSDMRASTHIAGHTDSVLCCEVLPRKLLASGGEVGLAAAMCAGPTPAALLPLPPPLPPAAPPLTPRIPLAAAPRRTAPFA